MPTRLRRPRPQLGDPGPQPRGRGCPRPLVSRAGARRARPRRPRRADLGRRQARCRPRPRRPRRPGTGRRRPRPGCCSRCCDPACATSAAASPSAAASTTSTTSSSRSPGSGSGPTRSTAARPRSPPTSSSTSASATSAMSLDPERLRARVSSGTTRGRPRRRPSTRRSTAFGPSLRRAHAQLVAAVDRGTISPASASVVWRTRVQQDDDAEVAADLGVEVRTLSAAASAPSASSPLPVEWQRISTTGERDLTPGVLGASFATCVHAGVVVTRSAVGRCCSAVLIDSGMKYERKVRRPHTGGCSVDERREEVTAGVRRWLGGLMGYCDKSTRTDFVPLVGYAEDMIDGAMCCGEWFASPVRALEQHWSGRLSVCCDQASRRVQRSGARIGVERLSWIGRWGR